MTESAWHETLSRNGFSGVDVVFRDYDDDRCHETSIMIATASGTTVTSPPLPSSLVIVTEESSLEQNRIAEQIISRLQFPGSVTCQVVSPSHLGSLDSLTYTFFVFLPELEKAFLRDIPADDFATLKRIICSARGLLWVGDGENSSRSLETNMVNGLSRTVRSENSKLVFATLAFEGSRGTINQHAETIVKVLEKTFSSPVENYEPEYAERNGMLHVNRLVEANDLNAMIESKSTRQQQAVQEFGIGPPLALTVSSPGMLDSLRFVEDKDFSKLLAMDEIEIEVIASGTNFIDTLIALGQVTSQTLGVECAGIVSRVGSGVSSFQIGDRVCACALGTYKSFVRCKALCAIALPECLSFIEGAALTATSITAYHALHQVARLKKGESILIHSGAGGTGQAAIQLSRFLGAEIYTTVSSEEKKKLLMDLYDIPEDHILYSRNLSFAQGIKRLTSDRGVDVVLNSLAGESLEASWECVAPFGRFIEIGKKDIYSHAKLPMFQFAKNVAFAAVDIAGMARERPDMIHELLKGVMDLVPGGIMRAAQPLHTYGVSEIKEAFRFLQSGKNSGKMVVEMRKSDLVEVCDLFLSFESLPVD